MNQPIGITAIASVSPLGTGLENTWKHYLNQDHYLKQIEVGGSREWVASLPEGLRKEIELLRGTNSKYEALDNSVLYALFAGRAAILQAGWNDEDSFGVNIGSSRGATSLFEKFHQEFIATGKSPTLSSPTTTLGNIASWVGHDLGTKGPVISHSITCSTALHALLNGIAWIKGGLSEKFLVGGSESPLTPFTIAQMKALKIYSNGNGAYPCRALDPENDRNTMVLGEAASMACLQKGITAKTLALIEGMGYATEPLEHNVSLSSEADCFQSSMKMAMGGLRAEEIDIIVTHSPGTIKGDRSELNAIQKIFGDYCPALSCNKWKIGHTFGASGMLSIEMAILMLQHQKFIGVPYLKNSIRPKKIDRILVNAVGFGGNAVSILLKRPDGNLD
ncbi:beta-ketoacyl synthase N-terminal-like domain-containing protein [Muriicola sp. Z0-33]|uniref:beta-ketoacyl synthase N-terminal-like domain-containing protein n=1 Tax=Muriicola sp. Z0-33 TaxID=2816957 RepID=UPI002238BD88|nr:beta-ketoacyl synthase N-terminal-like domain-containing protein [Muriicola sp. Z0-33]MCW5514960.1 beta-ketoacyl synthase [Muriicola sp. Z0-33]